VVIAGLTIILYNSPYLRNQADAFYTLDKLFPLCYNNNTEAIKPMAFYTEENIMDTMTTEYLIDVMVKTKALNNKHLVTRTYQFSFPYFPTDTDIDFTYDRVKELYGAEVITHIVRKKTTEYYVV